MTFRKNILKEDFKDLITHLVPVIFAIILFEITAVQIYIQTPRYHANSIVNFFVWRTTLAIGSFLIAYISDKFSRKQVLVYTQIAGILILPYLLFHKFGMIPLFLIGMAFVPTPVARAALIDNFPNKSKVKIIGITYIAQFLPWCFYLKLSTFDAKNVIYFLIIALVINILMSFSFFEDRRDKNHNSIITKNFCHKKSSKKIYYTLLALFCGQLVFFLSDTFLKKIPQNSAIFSTLGLGSLIGVIVGIFYRKLPHLSVLTFCFGMGLLLSIIPLITSYLDPNLDIRLSYQLMLFANLGGFYLPFVFDVVLSASSSKYRGTACGIIEFIIGFSSIIGVGIVVLFNPKELIILAFSSILFLIAAFAQKKGEVHG